PSRDGGLRIRAERRLQRSQLGLVEFRRTFILRNERGLAPRIDRDWHYLVAKDPFGAGLPRAGEAPDCVVILLLATDAERGCARIAARTHVLLMIDIPEAVVDHRVDQFAVA